MDEGKQAEYREAFALFDREGAGSITFNDLGTVLRSLGATPTEAELSEMARSSESGMLTFDEFADLADQRYTPDEVIEAFKVFDPEEQGLVNVSELRHVITSLGEKLTNEEVDEMFKEAQVSGAGMLAYKDFVSAMMKQ